MLTGGGTEDNVFGVHVSLVFKSFSDYVPPRRCEISKMKTNHVYVSYSKMQSGQ